MDERKFEEYCHIAFILGLDRKTIIKPQSAIICHVRLEQGFQLPNTKVIEITPLRECINDEPGLHIRESITTSKNPTTISIMIINETNRYYRLKKGSVVGKARPQSQVTSAVLSQWTWMKVKTPTMTLWR